MSRTKGARKYLSAMLDVNTNLIGKYWPDDVPIRLGAPLDAEIRGRIEGRPWTQAIDYYEVDALVERLATACFIVTAYLTGMRPEECRGLERGCCRRADPNDESSGYEIHGKVFKVRGSDGNFVSGGQERDQPWVTIDPVARTIAVMEKMHSHHLLFAAPAFTTKRPLREDFAVSVDKINGYITRLIEWWNQCAVENGWPVIPPRAGGPGRPRAQRDEQPLPAHGGVVCVQASVGSDRAGLAIWAHRPPPVGRLWLARQERNG